MLIENEITGAQLIAAYEAGQRRFVSIEVIDTEAVPVFNTCLSGAEFIDCVLFSPTFENVDFRHTRFVGCNLKCATFRGCDLSGSFWKDCAVESLSISACETLDLEATELHAYGGEIDGTSRFLDYAHAQKNV
jgi:uncharacterized protein YjbI with pentapeptide repeats